jgi:hypothetical protein
LLDGLLSPLYFTQHKHRRPSDLCAVGNVEQDPSVVSYLLIFATPKTLFPGINTVSSGSRLGRRQYAVHAVTNDRRHLGALTPRCGDREHFITPRIDVTSPDKVLNSCKHEAQRKG